MTSPAILSAALVMDVPGLSLGSVQTTTTASRSSSGRKLDNGDSQTCSTGPFDYHETNGFPDHWVRVLALDTAGNYHEAKNPAFPSYFTERRDMT